MGSCRRVIEYEEEDGWEITRDEITYYVYGKCEAGVTWTYDPPTYEDPGYVDWDVEDFNLWDVEVYDEHGDIVSIDLTDQEKEDFESYMRSRLDDLIDDYDDWDDDDYDYDDWDDEPEKDV